MEKNNELKEEYKNKYNLELLVYRLNSDELIELLEKILIGDNEFLIPFFSDEKNIDLDEMAFDVLLNLPYYLIERISECLNTIYVKASQKHYGKRTNRVIKRIITLGYNNVGLTNSTIVTYVTNYKLKCDFKIDLLFLLKHRSQHKFINNFLKKYDVFRDPLLLPFVISMSKNDKSILSNMIKFDSLSLEKPSMNICNWFESTIYDFVESQSAKKSYKTIAILTNLQTNWLSKIINNTIEQETKIEIAKQITNNTAYNKVYLDFKRKLASIKKKYATFDLEEKLINREDARILSDLSKWFEKLIPDIPPRIRLQVSTNVFETKGTDYESFSEKVDTISTELDLTKKIRETQNL